jgi:hypothetical protein
MRSVGFRSLLLAGVLILCHGVFGFGPLDIGEASIGHSEHVVAGHDSEKTGSEGSVGNGCLATLAVLLLGSVVLVFRWTPSGDRSRLLVFSTMVCDVDGTHSAQEFRRCEAWGVSAVGCLVFAS